MARYCTFFLIEKKEEEEAKRLTNYIFKKYSQADIA
jgi:hypothetical protein